MDSDKEVGIQSQMMRDARIKIKVTKCELLGIVKTRLYNPRNAPGL